MEKSPSLPLGFGLVIAPTVWLKHMRRREFRMTLEENPRAGEVGVLPFLK